MTLSFDTPPEVSMRIPTCFMGRGMPSGSLTTRWLSTYALTKVPLTLTATWWTLSSELDIWVSVLKDVHLPPDTHTMPEPTSLDNLPLQQEKAVLTRIPAGFLREMGVELDRELLRQIALPV